MNLFRPPLKTKLIPSSTVPHTIFTDQYSICSLSKHHLCACCVPGSVPGNGIIIWSVFYMSFSNCFLLSHNFAWIKVLEGKAHTLLIVVSLASNLLQRPHLKSNYCPCRIFFPGGKTFLRGENGISLPRNSSFDSKIPPFLCSPWSGGTQRAECIFGNKR